MKNPRRVRNAIAVALVAIFLETAVGFAAVPTSVNGWANQIISRAVPGGAALTSGNTGLRQPSASEIRARAAVAQDLDSITRGLKPVVPVKSGKQLARIGKELAVLRTQMRRDGATRSLMAQYAVAISPLFVYNRDLSAQTRITDLKKKQPIKLYPGETLHFAYRGQCTDHNLPAPSESEPVALVPMTEIFPRELQGVASDVVRYGSAHPDYPEQAVVWFLRSTGGNMDLSQYQYMQREIELAGSSDWATLASWQAQQNARAARKQLIGSLVSTVLSHISLTAQANSVIGNAQSLMTQLQGSSPAQIANSVAQQMGVVRAMPIQQAKPDDLSALSRYDGLDTVADANSLTVQGILYNAQPYPITFDPQQPMVAQAERPTQRSIGLPGDYNFPGYEPVDPSLNGNVEKAIQDGLEGLKNTPAAQAINALLDSAGDACSFFGIGEAASGLAEVPSAGSVLNFADAAAGTLNVFKVAATGTQLDGDAASPLQQFLDVGLVGGGVVAAIAAAPILAEAAGITAGLGLVEGLGAALDAGAAEEAAGAGAEEAGFLSGPCNAVSAAQTGQTVVSWGAGEPPNAADWLQMGNTLNHIFGFFR